jgi:spermidine/putrescine transport system permease protein
MPMIAPGIAAAFMLSVALSIDDYIITSFVAGSVSTFPREVFDSSRVEIPPQVHVIATITMVIAILVIVLSTVAGYRRERRLARQTAAPVLPPPPASLQS